MSILRRRGIHNHGVIGLGDMGTGALGGYREKVMGTGPIAYWMQAEAAGLTSICEINPAQNGTYTGVTLGQAGIGDGRTCPLYDGANDYDDVFSATFAGAFNGALGSVMIWCRASGIGVWTDSTNRRAIYFAVNASNFIMMGRLSANNTLIWNYVANAVTEAVTLAGLTTTDWFTMGMTWSAAADEVRMYYNGTQTGATQSGLGVWAGALNVNTTLIGAQSKAPVFVWDGYLAHCAIWDKVLTPTQMASLVIV